MYCETGTGAINSVKKYMKNEVLLNGVQCLVG